MYKRQEGNTWSIEVKDTGIGIPSCEQKKLFRNCFRGSKMCIRDRYFTYRGLQHDEPTEVYDLVKTVNQEVQQLAGIFLSLIHIL